MKLSVDHRKNDNIVGIEYTVKIKIRTLAANLVCNSYSIPKYFSWTYNFVKSYGAVLLFLLKEWNQQSILGRPHARPNRIQHWIPCEANGLFKRWHTLGMLARRSGRRTSCGPLHFWTSNRWFYPIGWSIDFDSVWSTTEKGFHCW